MKRTLAVILALGLVITSVAVAGSSKETPAAGAKLVTLTAFVAHSWYPVDTFTGHIAEQITKDTGVTLDMTIAVDGQQLGVLIASGDLPDLVYTDGQLDKLSNAKISYSYDELIEKYKLDWKIDPVLRGNSLLFSTDGKIYFVRNHAPTTDDWKNAKTGVPMAASLSIRQDIVQKLGNPKIATLKDLEAVYGKVKSTYPDMIPLVFNPWWRFHAFRVWSGVTMLDWLKQTDGTYKFYANTAVYQNYIRMLNSWFRKGYMIADNFAKTNEAGNWYSIGQAFSAAACTQNCNPEVDNELRALDPTFKSVELAPLDNKDYVTSDIGWSGTFISRKTANAEAAIKYMQYMFTPYAQKLTQMGREGADYTLDAKSGLPVFSAEWMNSLKDGTHNKVFNPWLYFGGSELVESLGRCASIADYGENYAKVYDQIRAGYRNEPWIAAAEPKGDSDERIALTKIKDMRDPIEARMIMAGSDAEFEAAYKEYVASMKSAGLDMLEAYMTKKIPEMRTKY